MKHRHELAKLLKTLQLVQGFFNAREPRDRDSHGRSSRMGTLDDAENLVFHDLDNNGFDIGEASGGPPHPTDSKMVGSYPALCQI